MRRTRLLLLVPALLALSGNSRTAAAGTTLYVDPNCWNNGLGTYYCNAYVTGGSGNYVSYAWQISDQYFGKQTYTTSQTTSGPEISGPCRIGGTWTVTVTVTDSQGAVATGTQTRGCSYWPD